jgi:hypothetical protein
MHFISAATARTGISHVSLWWFAMHGHKLKEFLAFDLQFVRVHHLSAPLGSSAKIHLVPLPFFARPEP